VNLAEISTRVGLSVSTVSRALRNADGVDAATRARVLAAAARAGYRGPARSLAGRSRTRTLLVLSHASGAVPVGAMAGMSRAAMELNVSIVTHQTPDESPESILNPRSQPTAMRAGQVDGVVLLNAWPEEVVRLLVESHPVVTLLHDSGVADYVGIDAVDGFSRLMAVLSETTSGTPAFFGCFSSSRGADPVLAAYRTAANGSPEGFDPARVSISTSELASEESKAVLAREVGKFVRNGVRSWICPNEVSAELLVDFLGSASLRMAESIAVLLPDTRSVPGRGVRWISLDVCAEDLGVAVVRRFLHRLEAPLEPVRSILLKTNVVPSHAS